MLGMESGVSYGVGDVRFPAGLHICHVFVDDGERARTLARYLARGLADGERTMCLVDQMSAEEVSASLATVGVDVAALGERLAVIPAEPAYCTGGPEFTPDEALQAFGQLSDQARAEGYAGLRLMGDMAWSARRGTPDEVLLAYEAKVKEYIERFRVTAVCEYDARRFDGALIMDLLAMHPATIVRGQIVFNPFYEEPAAYLAGWRARR